MKVYNLQLYDANVSNKKIFFILEKTKTKHFAITIYNNYDCLINIFYRFDSIIKEENNLYELVFNDNFVDSVLKADLDNFKYNSLENKKIFKKFQNEIKKISKK